MFLNDKGFVTQEVKADFTQSLGSLGNFYEAQVVVNADYAVTILTFPLLL